MELKHNKKHTKQAQELRKNATQQENHLWYDFLNTYPMRFRRQVTIDRFIVDFYCASVKLVIELDGSQHFDEQVMEHDAERTAILESYGLMVLRFSNNEVSRNFRAVCEKIDSVIKERTL